MSDNINDLIAEAREWSKSETSWGDNGLVDRLADALEAATRVPVQGEPKDDREALAKVMDTLAYYHCRSVNPKADHPRMGYHAMSEDQRGFLQERQREAAEEIVRMIPALSRASVPDAATELRAERDAAVAAIERVRSEASSVLMSETDPHSDWNMALDYLAKRIIKALDGAPEPEAVEWEYSVGHLNSRGIYCADADDYEEDCTTDIDEAREWLDQALRSGTYANAILLRKAPSPEWLPVEGESKP